MTDTSKYSRVLTHHNKLKWFFSEGVKLEKERTVKNIVYSATGTDVLLIDFVTFVASDLRVKGD